MSQQCCNKKTQHTETLSEIHPNKSANNPNSYNLSGNFDI